MTSPRLILFRAWPENEYKNNSQRTCRKFRTVACKLPPKMIQYSCQRSAYLRICIKPFGITTTGRFYYLDCFVDVNKTHYIIKIIHIMWISTKLLTRKLLTFQFIGCSIILLIEKNLRIKFWISSNNVKNT